MNTCIHIGNLTRDPELRTTQNGISVCTFTLAVNRPKDQNGESRADYIPIKCFKNRADSCARYLSKGRKVCVTGTVSAKLHTASDGTSRVSLELAAHEVEFLSPARGE